MRTRCKVGFPLSPCLGQLLHLTDLITYPSAGKLLPQLSSTQQARTKYHCYYYCLNHHCDNSPSPLISCMMFSYLNFHFLINKNKNDLCPSSAPGVAAGRGREVSQVHLQRKVPEGPKMLLSKAKCSVAKSCCSNLCLHLI